MIVKRILALLTAIFLLSLYAAAFFFALSDKPNSENWLMAAIFASVFLPVILYAWTLVVKFRDRNKQ